ncbi:hypothetical protein D8674_034050 [Pyrus ussuriensis x Pyrus communis]|uniref:Uncharacterized protein n=1 Tax=Pyrus ussuriensis x Pyrus communis TaxID=2448454 RepID=A0A5N5HN34_9ROSA|nr:hypothetical protein D8674_034050 [Pyrus ussuriensis x Pyrus communis]
MRGLERLGRRRGTNIRETNAGLTKVLRLATSSVKAVTSPIDCEDEEALGSRHWAFPIPLQYVPGLCPRV